MESGKDIPPSQKPLLLRAVGIIIGFLCLIWLPFEDTSTFFTVGLAAGISAWLAVRISLQSKAQLIRHILIGITAGVAVTPITLILMAIKGGLHDHDFADFLPLQVHQVLAEFPFWILGGLFFGLIIGVCRTSSETSSEEK